MRVDPVIVLIFVFVVFAVGQVAMDFLMESRYGTVPRV